MNESGKVKTDNVLNLPRIADLLNEAGMLANIPRSGYAFLGSGGESVAEHSFRTTFTGCILARLAQADITRVMQLCLFHDLPESRTGDFNYVNHRYNTCRAKDALADALDGTGLESEVMTLWEEFENGETLEARLARDADQLDLLCNLRLELYRGNTQAAEWIDSALPRLQTDEGRKLAEAILRSDPNHWWQAGVNPQWWINREKKDN